MTESPLAEDPKKPEEAETEEAVVSEESDVEEAEVPEPSSGTEPLKRRKKKRRSRRSRRITLVLVLILLAAAIVVINLPHFNVQNVSVIGNKRVEDAEIKRLAEMDDEQSIMGLNSLLAPHRIKINPYVDKVRIRRKMPDTVDIIVVEKKPAAQVATEEKEGKTTKYVAVYEDDTVLEISDEKMDIPYIKDVNVLEAKLKSKVKVEKEDSYEKAMEILKTARENDMFFKRVTVEGSWVDARIYGDIYCTGRYKNIISALENGNLRMVVYRLYQKNTREGTVIVGDNAYCSFTPKT